jgi:isochorismate synthase
VTDLYQHPLRDVDVVALRSTAARSGWLVETPEILRAGFGRAIKSLVIPFDDPSSGDGISALFDGVEFTGTFAAPTGHGPLAFASVPFDRAELIRLWLPEHVITVSDAGEAWLTSVAPDLRVALGFLDGTSPVGIDAEYDVIQAEFSPSPDGYARAVAAAVDEIRRSDLEKVVLARNVTGRTATTIDAAVVIGRLHDREPACTLYAVPGVTRGRFVGASPELLIGNVDGAVAAHPLAGTVALEVETDAEQYASWLLGSTKNLFEHRVVVDDIVRRLAERCDDVRAEARPSIVTLRSVAHLGTWIHAKASSDAPVSALELLRLLHPTPAVGGWPQEHALRVIDELEPDDRGLYAGAVGWLDHQGSGEWWITIRGVLVDSDSFHAWAGAGIVADSDPIAEREETRNKLASVLAGLGPLPR